MSMFWVIRSKRADFGTGEAHPDLQFDWQLIDLEAIGRSPLAAIGSVRRQPPTLRESPKCRFAAMKGFGPALGTKMAVGI
jgi:hypothetical protein